MTAAQASSPRAASSHQSPASAPVGCHHCGTTTDDPGLTWMQERDPRRGTVWFCPQCARRNLRAIEAKLDEDYW